MGTSAGAAPARPQERASAHHPYITDSLLVVLNPRRIPECVEAFKGLPLDVAYVRGMGENQAITATSRLVETGGYARYLICADDVIATTAAVRAVVAASRMNPHKVVTGYCNLDAGSPYVNVTRRLLQGETPTPAAYDFYRRDELPANGLIRSGLAGFALTCIPVTIAARVTPLGVYGSGWASDFHFSKRCEREGIQVVAAATGFVHHVKEVWNEPDQDPVKRLHLGRPRLAFQHRGREVPTLALINSSSLKGGAGRMSEKVAEKDITRVNDLGQTVVLVPAGQPIPEDLDLTGSSANGKAVKEPTEDKARKGPRRAKRKG